MASHFRWLGLPSACAAALLVLATLNACGGDDGPTREVGSAALLGFDSDNVTAVAFGVSNVPSNQPPLRVYLGVPGQDTLHLPQGRWLVEFVNSQGDKAERLETLPNEGEDVEFPPNYAQASEERRNDDRSAAATFVDFALIFRLGMLQSEDILTDSFTKSIDDPSNEITEEEYDQFVSITNGLSDYEPLLDTATSRLLLDSRHPELVSRVPTGALAPGPALALGPSAGALGGIKDFFTNNGKSGNDKRARDTFVKNSNPMPPDQRQQLFDDIRGATKDNPNVQNFGGIQETNPDDFFNAVRQGKYDQIAQDIEKSARANGDYAAQLQQSGSTPNERGKNEGKKALQDGSKVIEETIKQAVPGPGQKVIKIGEKINELMDKKGTPTPEVTATASPFVQPASPTTTANAAETATATAAVTAPPATAPPASGETPAPPASAETPTPPPAVTETSTPIITATVVPPTSAVTDTPTSSVTATAAPGTATTTVTSPPTAFETITPFSATPPPNYMNEITRLKVFLIELGRGDTRGTKSYEVDVRVWTKVRSQPAAMVTCVSRGHDIGSSSLFPGETFTIPLFRVDLFPGENLEVTCTIREGNRLNGSAAAPGTPTPAPCSLAQPGQLPDLVFAGVGAQTTDCPSPSPSPSPTEAETETPTPTPTATQKPTRPPTETETPTPAQTVTETPTPAPTLVDSFSHPGNVFAVSGTYVTDLSHLYLVCMSGIVNLTTGPVYPADIEHVNGIAFPGGCLQIQGNGSPVAVSCGSGEPDPDNPGAFRIDVYDTGPAQ